MSLYGLAPYGSLPYAGFTSPFSVADATEGLLTQPRLGRSWWVVAFPRDESTSTDPPTLIDLHLSTDGHKMKVTDAGLDLTSGLTVVQLDQAVIVPYGLTFGLSGKIWGQVGVSSGRIVLSNAQGNRTDITGHDWFGRQVDVYVGPRDGDQIQFAKVAQLLSRGVSHDESTIDLPVDDHGALFDRPLQTNTYLGTGGLEGGSEIKGRVKPRPFGPVEQMEPILVDSVNRIYQVGDGEINAIGGIDDQAVPLTFTGFDVADIEAIPAPQEPAAGEFTTSLVQGLLKLGSNPDGVITCNGVEGYVSPTFGYVDTIADLVTVLVVDFAGLLDPGELDSVAFTALELHTTKIGHLFDSKGETIRSALKVFHDSALSFGWLKPNKVYTVGRIVDPDTVTPTFTVDASDDELRMQPWKVNTWEVVKFKITVGYRPYFKTLTDTDIDTSVVTDLATRLDLGKRYRFVESDASDGADVLVQTPQAQEVTILTSVHEEVDAQALADEQFALRKVPRRIGTFSPQVGLLLRGIGDTMRLVDDRLVDSPKNWTVIGVRNRAEQSEQADEVVLDCFG